MQARERMIRERFAQQACTQCGSPYPPSGVLILARRRPAWMVMATCRDCDRRAIFVVTFPANPADHIGHPSLAADGPHLLPYALPVLPAQPLVPSPSASSSPPSPQSSSSPPSPQSSSSPPEPAPPPRPPTLPPVESEPSAASAPLSEADVEAIRDFLDRFDGDFRALFAHRRLADGSSS